MVLPVIAALEMCDLVFAVTEPTPLGKHDLELILRLLKRLDKKSEIILNQSDIGDKVLITGLAKKYSLQIACEIPYSKDIIDSYAKAIPITNEQIIKIVEAILK